MLILLIFQAVFSATAAAIAAAGVVAPILTQVVKNKLGVDSLWAYILHLVLSAGLAAGALWLSGELTAANWRFAAPMIAVISATLFQIFKKATGLNYDITPPSE